MPRRLIHPLLLGLCAAASGCMVHTYQPLSGLRRPILIDTQATNFQDVRLKVRCSQGDLLSRVEARSLCRKVRALFENQGARVLSDDGLDDVGAGASPDQTTDLELELVARKVYTSNRPLTWALCAVSFTLLPGISEETFAQDIVIRDGSGFLLARDSLEGRLVHRFGAGPWVGNKLADWLVRGDDEKLTGDTAEVELSADMYGQLSQIVFNAKMQWQVLQQTEAPSTDEVPR